MPAARRRTCARSTREVRVSSFEAASGDGANNTDSKQSEFTFQSDAVNLRAVRKYIVGKTSKQHLTAVAISLQVRKK